MNKERKAPVHITLTFGLKLARDYRSEEIVKILGQNPVQEHRGEEDSVKHLLSRAL